MRGTIITNEILDGWQDMKNNTCKVVDPGRGEF